MAGVAVTVELRDVEGVVGALDELLRRGANLKPALTEIGKTMVDHTHLRFEAGVEPSGARWLATRRGGQILRDTGRLESSITFIAGDDQVEVGTNVIYGAIHQHGGTIKPRKLGGYLRFKGRDGKPVFARQVTIPARPYLGLDQADREDIPSILEGYLGGALPGGGG